MRKTTTKGPPQQVPGLGSSLPTPPFLPPLPSLPGRRRRRPRRRRRRRRAVGRSAGRLSFFWWGRFFFAEGTPPGVKRMSGRGKRHRRRRRRDHRGAGGARLGPQRRGPARWDRPRAPLGLASLWGRHSECVSRSLSMCHSCRTEGLILSQNGALDGHFFFVVVVVVVVVAAAAAAAAAVVVVVVVVVVRLLTRPQTRPCGHVPWHVPDE